MQRNPDIPGLTDLIEIGHGGNGVVYRANQQQLRRVVAVKLLTTRLDELSAQRFALESQALGSMSGHPNVVPIYTADTLSDGSPYFVMQLCEHGSLDDRLRSSGPLPVPLVLDLGIRMCGALQTAHEAGLLHRDIKPGNILFDSYDVPRLADFGQARMADTRLTRTGDVVATPGYAAPEVLTGEPATVRSDVYSLAATLMAALLGSGPFHRDGDESVAAVLLRVLQEPPPDLRGRGVPDVFAATLEKAMGKTPGLRQMSAGEFGRRLQDVQRELGLSQTPMVVAPEAASSPLAPRGGPGEAPTSWVPQEPTRANPTAPIGLPTMRHEPGRSPEVNAKQLGPRRRRGTWIAAGVVTAIVLGLGGWGLSVALASADPTNPQDAADLLIGSDSYGPGTWQATEDMALLTDVIGQLPETPEEADSVVASALNSCMGLDPAADVTSAKASAQYVDNDVTDESSGSYRIARSQAIVASSVDVAQNWVQAWSSPQFDTCLDELSDLGISMGNESTLYGQPAQISVPEYEPDVPDGVQFQARQVAIALDQNAGDEESATNDEGDAARAGWRYVTVLAMSAGTSVAYVVMQSNEGGVSEEMIDPVTEAFVELATE